MIRPASHPSRKPLTSAVLAILMAGSYAAPAARAQELPPAADALATPAAAGSESASDAGAPGEAPAMGAADTALDVDKIIVTGSRIPRAGFDTLEPAAVVSHDYIEGLNLTNIADALFAQPSFQAGASSRGDQADFGAGVNFLSRFGLGSQRVLTLVNGRRFVTSNPPTTFGPDAAGLQVDLNVIPTALVQEVEILGIGGAPTYGSDAIAGVTNILLRRDFEGVETTLGYGQSSKGDAQKLSLSTVFGSNFADDRGNVTLAVSTESSDGLLASQRDYYRQGYDLRSNPYAGFVGAFQPGRTPGNDGRLNPGIGFDGGPGDGVPANVWIRDSRIDTMTWGGVLFPGWVFRDPSGQLLGFGPDADQLLQFDGNGQLVAFDPGNPFGFHRSSGGDGFDLNETRQLVSDLDRESLFALGSFEFTDSLSGFFEASLYRVQSSELADQGIYNAAAFGWGSVDGSGDLDGMLDFHRDNPFLTDQARAKLDELGIESFYLSRAYRDIGNNRSTTKGETWRVVGGLKGYWDVGPRLWNWEASLNHGRSNYDYHAQQIHQQRFLNAINVTRDAQGRIVCDASAPGTVADAACRPLNLFGANTASAEALAYVSQPTRARSAMEQTVFNANVSGGLLDLPGGELAFNVGVEHRREHGSFTPDPFQREGLGRRVALAGSDGGYSTNEVFGEVIAPLFADAGPGLHRLDLTAKVRRVQNSEAGWFTAYTYGLQYEPFAGLQLRGNQTRSFRAPSVSELFTAQQPTYFFIPEACSADNVNAGAKPATRRSNCDAFFAAHPDLDPATFDGPPGSVLGSLSGSTQLRNEKADSWTAGLVLKPAQVPGLRAALDYYSIQLSDAITALEPGDLASGCFDNDVFDASDVDNANAFCSQIHRNAAGYATGIDTRFANGPYIRMTGWTGEVNYRLDLQRLGVAPGHLDLGFYGYAPTSLARAAAPGVPPEQLVGSLAAPRRELQWTARYSSRRWNAGLSANYISSAVFANDADPEARESPRAASYTTWDMNVGYRFSEHTRINLAVQNVTDNNGPFPYVYDDIGRRWSLSTTIRF